MSFIGIIMLSREQQGLLCCIASQVLWGVGILFWPLLSYLQPVSILSLRMVCSFLFAILLITATKRLHLIKNLFANRKIAINLMAAATFLAINWGVYIYAINNGKAIEVSLGYYITPILSIIIGRIVFNDVLNKYQILAIFLVVIGVSYGMISYGHIPYYGLILGFTFAIYGFLHKIINANAISILCAETMIVSPFAIIWLICTEPNLGFIGYEPMHYVLLAGTIAFTGVPLMLFSYAAITVSFTTIGFILYLSPSINFLLAIFCTDEAVKPSDYITFPIVWLALIIYTADMFYKNKRLKKHHV